MALNRNAYIRYQAIDRCLHQPSRDWTLADLQQAASLALNEINGKKNTVSRRTLQLDLQFMRDPEKGFGAPIEVYGKRYYRYADPNFSIRKTHSVQSDFLLSLEHTSGRAHKTIRIRILPGIWDQLKVHPLHPEQKIVQEKKKSQILEFPAVPGSALEARLLSLGTEIEVLSPGKLRKAIAMHLQRAAKLYQ